MGLFGKKSRTTAPGSASKRVEALYQKGMAEYELKHYDTAFPILQKAAEKGHADAQFYCGMICQKRRSLSAVNKEALYWFEKAAGQGNVEAQYKCGLLYSIAVGAEKDLAKALYWFEKAAEQGNESARESLARLKKQNEPKPETQSGEQKRESAEPDIEQLYNEGLRAYRAGDAAKALGLFEQAAEQGHVVAQYRCGMMYFTGKGTAVKENKKKAFYWFEQAARQGNLESQYHCGMMYRNGRGTTMDKEKALYWLEEAAKQGDCESQYECGVMYAAGEGAAVDPAKTKMWLEKAAAQPRDKKGQKEAKQALEMLFKAR